MEAYTTLAFGDQASTQRVHNNKLGRRSAAEGAAIPPPSSRRETQFLGPTYTRTNQHGSRLRASIVHLTTK